MLKEKVKLISDEAEAIRIAGIKEEEVDKFLDLYRKSDALRKLPKAHLHIHSNCCIRNTLFKEKLAEYNSDPNVIEKIKSHFNDAISVEGANQNQIKTLFGGELLHPPPESLWHEDGSLKVLTR